MIADAHTAIITVYHNNVLVQDKFNLSIPTQSGTLRLQDRLNPVRFRNIWFAPGKSAPK